MTDSKIHIARKNISGRRMALLLGAIVLYFLGSLLFQYAPPFGDSKEFTRRVEATLASDHKDGILLASATDFNWDSVCLSHAPIGIGHGNVSHLNTLEKWVLNKRRVALVFFDKNQLVRMYGFPPRPTIRINDQPYCFGIFSRDSGGLICATRKEAVLSVSALGSSKNRCNPSLTLTKRSK